MSTKLKKENCKEKGDIYDIFIFIIALWFLLLVIGFIALFDSGANSTGDKIQALNNFGGFMNLSSSLAGVATIFLLSKAIYNQTRELDAMKDEMESQRKSIENEEKTNRTIKYIDEWVAHYDTAEKKVLTEPQRRYIVRLHFLFNSEAKSKIDFKLLSNVIFKYGLHDVLKAKIQTLNHEKERYKQSIFNNSYSQDDLSNAQGHIQSLQDAYTDMIEDGRDPGPIDDIMKMSPEEYVSTSAETEILSIEKQLNEIKSYVKLIRDMREDSAHDKNPESK